MAGGGIGLCESASAVLPGFAVCRPSSPRCRHRRAAESAAGDNSLKSLQGSSPMKPMVREMPASSNFLATPGWKAQV